MSEYTFKLPDLGEGTVESEIGEWFIKVGDQVTEEDIVGTMMTDKAAVELSSPISGKVVKLAGEPGDVVAVGAALVVFDVGASAEQADSAVAAEAIPATAAPTPQTGLAEQVRVMTSPAVRRRAKEAGIDLAVVPGTGPGGRVTRQDFEQFVGATSEAAHTGKTKEIKVIGLRRIIAERMATSSREIPHFTYVEEIDITELEALRQHLNEKIADRSARLTLLPFLGLALIRALQEFPQCNTTYDKEHNVLLQHRSVHLGIATQTPDGLKVPVVHHADSLSVEDLGHEIRRVSEAARSNSIKKNELSGSTITIRAVERPVVINGQVAVRLMMNLSSSFDHRFVDGYDAAAMIQRIKEMLEYPATIFLP